MPNNDNEPKPIKTERIDNPDGSYVVKEVYGTPICYSCLSCIEKYNKNGKIYYGEYYKDNKFQELAFTGKRIYNKDGSYTNKTIFTKANFRGALSEIDKYDKNDKCYYAKHYNDNNFKKLFMTEEIIYNNDGTFVCKMKDVELKISGIEKYNQNSKCYYTEGYKGINFENLDFKSERIYNEDKSSIEKVIYIRPICKNTLSKINKYNKNNQIYYVECYKDNNFNDLDLSHETIYNEDGSYIEKYRYSKPNENGDLSIINYYNKNNSIYYSEYYKDDNFKDLDCTLETIYHNNGTSTVKWRYSKHEEDQILSQIAVYNEYDRPTHVEDYKDTNFEYLARTDEKIYKKDVLCVQKTVLTESNELGFQSIIEYYNKDELSIRGLGFRDNNFTELLQDKRAKFKKNSTILFTQYSEPSEDGYFSEIIKMDKDYNQIYKKQYKFKGLLAKILFWLSW